MVYEIDHDEYDKKSHEKRLTYILEFSAIQKLLFRYLKSYKEKVVLEQKISTLAAQVAHDIRSPLTALDMLLIGTQDQLPEKERFMMRTAIRRINNISNDLVLRYKGREASVEAPVFIYSALKDIVFEKDLECSQKNIKFDFNMDHPKSAFLLSCGNYTEIKRMFSNIINNAVNAMPKGGIIRINCLGERGKLEIKIIDQGCGLAQKKIQDLLSELVPDDAKIGLGLRHAKKYMKQFGGSISMISEEGVGTEVSLTFQLLAKPFWLCEEIRLYMKDEVIILDDDTSIHNAWLKKLENFPCEKKGFYSPQDCRDYLKNNRLKSMVIFCDYEFINISENGVSFLKTLNSPSVKKYLVTSNIDDAAVISACEEFFFELLPKHLLPYVNISFFDQPLLHAPEKNCAIKQAIFLDDDDALRMAWEFRASLSGVQLYTFESYDAFLRENKITDLAIPVFIDLNFGDDRKGFDIALCFYEAGFKNIFIATGEKLDDYPCPGYLAGIIGKIPPF